jgi:hypothetical protein
MQFCKLCTGCLKFWMITRSSGMDTCALDQVVSSLIGSHKRKDKCKQPLNTTYRTGARYPHRATRSTPQYEYEFKVQVVCH